MIHIEDVLLLSAAQDSDRYVFGAAPDFMNPDPQELPSSTTRCATFPPTVGVGS